MSLRPLLCVCLWLAFAVCSPVASLAQANTSHRVPMSLVGTHPRIDVRIDSVERPLSFVVDTAAGASVVDAALAERLGLIDTTRTMAPVHGAGGSVAGARVTGSLDLSAGTFAWKAQLLAIDLSHIAEADAPPIDGILGNDLLTRFDTRFDLPARQLTLAPAGSLSTDGCLDNALPGRADALRRFPFVPAQLQDGDRTVDAMAVVDSGAAQTVLNWPAARALGLAEGEARLRSRADGTRGLSNDAIPTWLYALPTLAIDGRALPTTDVRISALPVFATLGLDTRPALILGVDALHEHRIDVLAGAAAVCLRPAHGTIGRDTL